jgi:hypothetical protein
VSLSGVWGIVVATPTMRLRHAIALAATAIFVLPVALFAQTSTASPGRETWNVIDRIGLPPEQQDGLVKSIVAELASGKVPTARRAREALLGNPTGPIVETSKRGLGADEAVAVTGLFYVERSRHPVGPDRQPELVWEVVFSTFGIEVREVYWVSAKTGVVYPIVPPKRSN